MVVTNSKSKSVILGDITVLYSHLGKGGMGVCVVYRFTPHPYTYLPKKRRELY